MKIETFREGMSVVDKYCFLNHASNGPLHNDVVAELHKSANYQINGNVDMPFDNLTDGFTSVRTPIAQLLNCRVDEVALTSTTAHGIALVLDSFDWSNPSEKGIILDDLEYTSNSFAYQQIQKKFKVKIHVVQNKQGNLDLNDFETILANEQVTLVGLSHVQFTNGFKSDLNKIHSLAHNYDALLLVDAIQSCGALQIDAKEADFIAVGSYKWCLGPLSTGFLYLNNTVQQNYNLEPVYVSSLSDEKMYNYVHHEFHPHKTAQKFQTTLNWNYLALGKAIELLNEVGKSRIEETVFNLTDYLVEGLNTIHAIKVDSNREFDHKSGIVRVVALNNSINLEEIVKKLQLKYTIIVSYRNHGLRISPHFYNSFDEIDKFITAFKSLIEL